MSGYWPTSISENNAAAFWGFWAQHIYHIRYENEALPPYQNLFHIAKERKYFIVCEGFNTPPFKAFLEVLNPESNKRRFVFYCVLLVMITELRLN